MAWFVAGEWPRFAVDESGTAAATGMRDRFRRDAIDGDCIIAVNRDSWEIVLLRFEVNFVAIRTAVTNEKDGQVSLSGLAHGFVQGFR